MRRLKVYSSVQTNLDTAWHFLNLAPILHLSCTFPLCISITSIGNVGKNICEGVERQNKRYACHTIHIIDVGMCSRLVRRIALAVSMYIVLFFSFTQSRLPPVSLNTRLHNCTFSQPGCAEAVCRTDAMLCARGRTPSRSVALSTSGHVIVRSL